MRAIRAICRFCFGMAFILSGILKLIDPTGTGLIVSEYLNWLHLDFLNIVAQYIGIALSVTEFTIGVNILVGLRMKLFSLIGLLFISFFTIITLFLVIFNPIEDCGCFGEAIHLSNSETLTKNIILLVMAIVIFLQRDKYRKFTSPIVDWISIFVYIVLGLYISIHAIIYNPRVDFTDFQVGANLKEISEGSQRVYQSTFIYSKDGETQEFDINNLPDSTWTYVDTKTSVVSGDSRSIAASFEVTDADGNTITESLFENENFFIATIYNNSRMSEKRWKRLSLLQEMLKQHNIPLYVIVGANSPAVEARSEEFNIIFSDYKTILTMNRSNGGVLYVNEDFIIKKWASKTISASKIEETLSQDIALTEIKEEIKEQVSFAIIIAFIFISAIVVRFVYGLTRKKE